MKTFETGFIEITQAKTEENVSFEFEDLNFVNWPEKKEKLLKDFVFFYLKNVHHDIEN